MYNIFRLDKFPIRYLADYICLFKYHEINFAPRANPTVDAEWKHKKCIVETK